MQTISSMPASAASRIASAAIGRRHVDHAGVAPVSARASCTVSNTGRSRCRGAAFPGRHAADHLGAVGDRLLGMEGALRAGEALADHRWSRLDEDRHHAASLQPRATTLRAASSRFVGGDERQPRLAAGSCAAEFDIGAFEPHDQRHVQIDLARRRDDALGDHVAAHDAAEDVDQDRLDVRVGQDQLERDGDPLVRRAAADIEEIGRVAAVQLDDVHRRHREAGAVDHAADIAVELDVVELRACRPRARSGPPRPRRAAPRCRDGGTARCRRSRSWRRAPAARPSR